MKQPREFRALDRVTAVKREPIFLVLALILGFALTAMASLEELEANLLADLEDRCTGYAYVIHQNGSLVCSGSGGLRVEAANLDADTFPFNLYTRKGVHSMSKTITAVAILQALESRGFNLSRPISADFPEDFRDAISDGRIHLITYRDILRHESGFPEIRPFNADWNDIRAMIADGLESDPPALVADGEESYAYSNVTYGLCRVLVATLLYPQKYQYLQDLFPSPWILNLFNPIAGVANDDYFNHVQEEILKPSGVYSATTGSLLDPEEYTSYNFAKYHHFLNPSIEPALMQSDKNYRSHVGAFGWAMSAYEYARFISNLFNGGIVSEITLAKMRIERLGMGYHSATQSYGHAGSHTVSSGVAGRCAWVHFANQNIQVVVQVNSSHNWFRASGTGLLAVIREAYENAFSTPKATGHEYPLHVLFRRQQDGFMVSRGVRKDSKDASFRRRNFDSDWSGGWTHFRTVEISGQYYGLHYKANEGNESGRGLLREINPDGTFGDEVFDQTNWRAGWTHLEFFSRLGDTYLLLHNQNDAMLRIYRLNNDGTLQTPAVTNTTAASGFNILKIIEIGGQDKLFRHETSSGRTLLTNFETNGALGNTFYDQDWDVGFTDFQFYRSNGNLFLLRYSINNGRTRINQLFGSQFESTPELLDEFWHDHWTVLRFFTIDGKTFNYRYDPDLGLARMQAIKSDGTFNQDYVETDELLRSIPSQGAAHSGFTGWTEIEFYRASVTPAISDPFIEIPPADTNGEERDNDGAGLIHGRYFSQSPDDFEPPGIHLELDGSALNLSWQGEPGTVDISEFSLDLESWEMYSAYLNPDDSSTPPTQLERLPLVQDGIVQEKMFSRIKRFPSSVRDQPRTQARNNSPRLP